MEYKLSKYSKRKIYVSPMIVAKAGAAIGGAVAGYLNNRDKKKSESDSLVSDERKDSISIE